MLITVYKMRRLADSDSSPQNSHDRTGQGLGFTAQQSLMAKGVFASIDLRQLLPLACRLSRLHEGRPRLLYKLDHMWNPRERKAFSDAKICKDLVLHVSCKCSGLSSKELKLEACDKAPDVGVRV